MSPEIESKLNSIIRLQIACLLHQGMSIDSIMELADSQDEETKIRALIAKLQKSSSALAAAVAANQPKPKP